MNGLDLFSGIGGMSIALQEWVRPITYCEIDPYCQGVLLSRMADESLCNGPIWDDIKTLDGTIFEGAIDIIYGGFPCQDISIAGHGKGLEGERSGLFFEILRLAKEIKPKFIFLENVPAITTRGGVQVVREIASLGYDCRWCIISAASIGALHRRERWFLLAYTNDNGSFASKKRGSIGECTLSGKESGQQAQGVGASQRTSSISSDVANSDKQSSGQTDKESKPEQNKKRTRRRFTRWYWPFESREHWKEIVSSMDKCSDGISSQVDRLRSLGNAVVPQQAKEAFKILMGINARPSNF